MSKYLVFLEFLLIIIIIIILFFSILFINVYLINYFKTIKNNFFNEFNELTNLSIKYQRISPFLIGKIKIFEVILYDSEGLKLELGNIEIHYSLFSLFINHKNPLSIFNKIVLKNFDLRIYNNNDYENVKNIINKLKLIKKPNRKSFKIKNLSIEIPKGKIHIFNNDREYLLTSDYFKMIIAENISIDSNINIFIKDEEDVYLSSKLKTNGDIYNLDDKYSSKFNLNIENIIFFDNTEIKPQKFLFETNNKNFILKRIEDSLPVTFTINKKENLIYSEIDISELDVKKLFKLENKNRFFPDLLTLKSKLNINLKEKKFNNGELIFQSYYDKLVIFNKLNFDLNISLRNRNIIFNKFIINNITEDNYLKLTGNYPLFNSDYKLFLSINNFLLPQTKIDTDISIVKSDNQTNITSSDLLLNDINFNNFFIKFIKNNNKIEVKTIKSINGYSLNGSINKKDKNYLRNFNHYFTNFSISKIIKAYKKDYNKEIILNGGFDSDFNQNNFKISNSNFILYKEGVKSSNLNLELINNLFSLIYSEIDNQEKPFNIYTSINFNKKPFLIFINYQKNNTKFDIISEISRKRIKFVINDNLIIQYNPIFNTIDFNSNDFKIPNNTALVNFNFILNLDNMTINENRISVSKMKIFKNQIGNLNANVDLHNNTLSVKNIIYIDKNNKIEGELINNISTINNNIILDGNGFLKDDHKDESYSLNYNIDNSEIDAKLYITNMNINKIAPKNIQGNINSRINITGDINNPDFYFDLNTSNGKFANKDFNMYFVLNKKNKVININKASFQINQNRIYLKNSSIKIQDNKSKSISINGDILLKGLQKIFKTNFLITGYTNSIFNDDSLLNINILFNNLTLGFMKGYNLDDVEKYPDQKFNILKVDNDFQILKNGEKILSYNKNKNNILIKLFKEDKETLDSSIDLLKDNNIYGKIKFNKFPINFIQKLLLPFVGIDDGLLLGDIELKGKLLAPEFYGDLNVFYGLVSLDNYLEEPIKNITGAISIEKNRILVKNVNAQSKNGLAHGYGEILLNGWKLESYEFHINTDNIPALIKRGPVDAKGIGYIEDFIIEGKPKNYSFTGYFVIEEADVNLESLLGLNKKEKLKSIPLNVYITFKTGNNVKIIHPLISGTIAPNEEMTLKFIGEEARIYLGGKFKLKKGEVNYLNKRFIIEHADFQFFDNEAKINPKVNLKSYYRTKDFKRDSVIIYLTINNRLIPFKSNFSSSPYKSQQDINAMLGFPVANIINDDNNVNFNKDENTVNIDSIADTTDYLSNSIIFTPFENRIRKIIRLDTFSMETKFLGNIIKSNYELTNNTYDLLDESSIKIGKYLSNELYFESMFSFNKKKNYDDVFFLPLSDQNYGLNLKLMLQLELQFFMIGYTFLPKDLNNLYKSDHNIFFGAEFKF